MKNKIVFVKQNLVLGGIEPQIIRLSKYFADKGYVVQIICLKIESKIEKIINNNIKITKYKN